MACNAVSTNAGAKLYIAPAANIPASNTKSAWEAVTGWEEIAEPSNISSRGHRRNIIEYKPLSGSVCKQAGSVNNGTLSFRVADIPEDAGQQLLETASTDNLPYPLKIVHDDATTTLDAASAEYLTGIVATYEHADAADSDSIRERMAEVAINDYLFVPRYDSTP